MRWVGGTEPQQLEPRYEQNEGQQQQQQQQVEKRLKVVELALVLVPVEVLAAREPPRCVAVACRRESSGARSCRGVATASLP